LTTGAAAIAELSAWALTPMQWRGSDDGIAWSGWQLLPSLKARLPAYAFYQGRVWVASAWRTSPIATAD
jgi:hypothetical protein